ncbi:tannase/feruloyl esterase family alpha/beta hydrolase [Sphingomonas canadensis]|uniref:Tannase/feruloyl esterase family alpha/beta hydrolase n=1 Tax=Sphingomonas canadensis TaxID=1219257 RepID=A0ABW3H979_9SPHN|nr:tannase/feruloyl esterase family alpha/beta hydrolase [Sphingomonas canadensis]MCW3836988.1 tannase/feruloyl esterase family alpha/beta hydrolase [Sphingomonas canadensis]
MRNRIAAGLAMLAAMVAFAADGAAALAGVQAAPRPPVVFTPLPERAEILPVMGCDALAAQNFLGIEGAPARITATELQTRENGRQFCMVRGIIAPQIQFEFHLPLRGYTGRYLQGGCGGACGVIYKTVSPSCDNQVAFDGAFAVSFNNSGHVGPAPMDTLWAAYDPQLRIDFAYRAAHVMAVTAKEILAVYYGSKPAYSYFMGCSNGGREAMMEAQRYPGDFDGIVAGAPALWITGGVTRIIHEARIARDEAGQLILTQRSTEILHKAVMAACDGLDGLVDGQIDSARACRFDPRTIMCKPGQAEDCLTPRQAEVMAALYRGATDAQGRQLFFGGEPYGSELLWAQPGSFLLRGSDLAANQIKFMIYGGESHQDFDWQSWAPGKAEVADLMEKGGYYNANNPDLSAFKASGGKLIMWQGEADNAGGSHILQDYYQNVRDTMGGFAGTHPFLRVYFLPGVYHCSGGYIAYEHDMLGAIVTWVERGSAPDAIVGAAVLADGKVRTRPVYPYPVMAKYKGKGDINAAENFKPVRPKQEPNDHFDWVGAGMTGGAPPKGR